MAPSIEIPVVFVVGEALRRDDALAGLVAAASIVGKLQALALQQCGCNQLKLGLIVNTGVDGQDANSIKMLQIGFALFAQVLLYVLLELCQGLI